MNQKIHQTKDVDAIALSLWNSVPNANYCKVVPSETWSTGHLLELEIYTIDEPIRMDRLMEELNEFGVSIVEMAANDDKITLWLTEFPTA